MSDAQPLFAALPAALVQFFFIWRIWSVCMAVYGRLVRMLVRGICLFLVFTSLCAFISALMAVAFAIHVDLGGQSSTIAFVLLPLWTVSSAVTDVLITICMIVILCHARTKSFSGETYSKVSRLLRVTVQTGFLSSALAICIAALNFMSKRTHGLYLLPVFLLGKSYIITLFANLNSRSSQGTPAPARAIDRVATRKLGLSGWARSLLRSLTRTNYYDLTSAQKADSS